MPLMISKMHMNTSPPRERGRRGHRSGEEEFVLYLQGIPPHCRWQELKDFVRQTALHIRQAVVYDDQHGYPTGLGQIIVKNEDEAWRTYRKLSATGWDGHPLTVTLARASSPTRPIAGPTKSSSSGGLTLPYGGKVARHSIAGTPTPESPVTTESHSIASGAIYPQYVPPCTPTGHSHGHIQGYSPIADSPRGYGPHHHTPAGWNMQPDRMGMLAFSPPGMTMFSPPLIEQQQQIEYPYYFPYSHPMQIPVRGQPMYAETRYHNYQQQQAPSNFFSQYPPPANQYYQHQQQGYQVYGYESRKHSFHSNSTSDIYTNPETTAYNNDGGIMQHQALPQGIRHIIIDNICPGVDIRTLQDHVRDAGHMLHCKIIRYNNHENGNEAQYNELSYPGQCYATATFSTAEEAERAVGMYNGSDLGGSRVVVRLDTEWDPSSLSTEEGNGNGNGNGNGDGGGESDWSRSQSYSVSFTTSSNALLASSVSSSTATSLGTFSAYSESPNSQLSSIPPTNKIYHRHHKYQQHRERRDSGKEIFKPNTHPFLPSQSAQSDCVDDNSSRSVSPTSGTREAGNNTEEEKSRTTTTIMQPLVVNGSGPVGRAKM